MRLTLLSVHEHSSSPGSSEPGDERREGDAAVDWTVREVASAGAPVHERTATPVDRLALGAAHPEERAVVRRIDVPVPPEGGY